MLVSASDTNSEAYARPMTPLVGNTDISCGNSEAISAQPMTSFVISYKQGINAENLRGYEHPFVDDLRFYSVIVKPQAPGFSEPIYYYRWYAIHLC